MTQLIDLGKLRFNFSGDWVSSTQYETNDVVKYGGNAYVYTYGLKTSGNLPTNTTYWKLMVEGINFLGNWSSGTAYKIGDSVAYGGVTYIALADTTNESPDVTPLKWSKFVDGIQFAGAYNPATAYQPNDVVSYGGRTFIALATVTGVTPSIGSSWASFADGVRWTGAWTAITAYLPNDVVSNGVSTYIATQAHTSGSTFSVDFAAGKFAFFAKGAADILPVIESGQAGFAAHVAANGTDLVWLNATGSDNVFYVAPDGSDSNPGTSLALPFASIKHAVSAVPAGQAATIFVKTGTYNESALPIVIPANTAIVGDNQRTVVVQPAGGLAADGTTPNSQATMFLMSNGSILNKMTFVGMTGWVPGSTAADVTTSTIKGVVVRMNPDSPITTKSPYVLECAAIGSGLIGALIDGSVHASGNKSMIFHGFTVISDGGIGYWTKDGGKAEIVSCFTYYCYFGYTSSGGGQIRALNGNNSYGTWGATSRGFDANETPVTGALLGQQLNFIYGGGNINVGDTVTSSSGATAIVTNVQTTANKVYVRNVTGTFSSGDTLTFTSGGTGTVSNGALENQKGFVLVMNNLTARPVPGQSIQIAGDSVAYVVQSVSGSWTNASSVIAVVLAQEKPTGSANGAVVTLRSKYSQIRLTGHDFLSIGTGGVATTNYPGTPTQPAAQGNETDEAFPGRVFYVSTDQDGNFRVGEYFRIDQATGRATLNASAFDLAGLTSLRLGSIGAQLGETINEFSSDGTLSGNSNVAVPTEQAVKTYVDNNATPTGGTLLYAAPTKSGYLKCDGSVYSKSAYPALATVIGSIEEPLRWSPIGGTFWNTLNPVSSSFRFHARSTSDDYVYHYSTGDSFVWRVRQNDQSQLFNATTPISPVLAFAPYNNTTHSHHATVIYKNRYFCIGGNDAPNGRSAFQIWDLETNQPIVGRLHSGGTNNNCKVWASSNYFVASDLGGNVIEYTSATPTGGMSFNSVSVPFAAAYGEIVGTKFVFTSVTNWSTYAVLDLETGSVTGSLNTHMNGQPFVSSGLYGASNDKIAVFCGNAAGTYFAYRADEDRFQQINIPDQTKVSLQRIEYFDGLWVICGYWLDAPATGSSFVPFTYASNDGMNWKNIGLYRTTFATAATNMPQMPIIGNTFVGIRPATTMTDAAAQMYNRFPYDRTTQFMVPLLPVTEGAYPLIKT